jgi:8-oxo-dGTP pyrophosphatase MutT (NUDIX family)
MKKGTVRPWNRERSSIHSDCGVYRILKERWKHPVELLEGDFFVMEVRDWAVAIALTPDNQCVLVRQFRFGNQRLSLEFPAGVVDPGEDFIAGAERELYEESGYRGESASLIGVTHPNPAIQRNRCFFVLIENARKVDSGEPDPHEFFDVDTAPLDRLYEWAKNGTITHGIVHAALFFLRDHLDSRTNSQ